VDQKRHKVKRQRSNKRPESHPEGTNEVCPHREGDLHNSRLASPGALRGGAQVCTRGAGAGQRAVLSDSSSESLFSVTECRRACSRGLRRSGGPSSTWMEGMSKWTRS